MEFERRSSSRPSRPRSLGTWTTQRLVASAVIAVAAIGVNLLQACTTAPCGAGQRRRTSTPSSTARPTSRRRCASARSSSTPPASCASSTAGAAPRRARRPRRTTSACGSPRASLLPAGYTGTVYQNGYDLQYLSSDHHVVGLGSAIYNIHTLNNILFWDAGGVISDHNGDDDYRWCYAYTVVAWPKVAAAPVGALPFFDRLDIAVTHADQHASQIFTDLGTGGVHRIKGVHQSSTGTKPQAVLLAGFRDQLHRRRPPRAAVRLRPGHAEAAQPQDQVALRRRVQGRLHARVPLRRDRVGPRRRQRPPVPAADGDPRGRHRGRGRRQQPPAPAGAQPAQLRRGPRHRGAEARGVRRADTAVHLGDADADRLGPDARSAATSTSGASACGSRSFSYLRLPGDSFGTLRYTVRAHSATRTRSASATACRSTCSASTCCQPTIHFDPGNLPPSQPRNPGLG